jgi:3-hydroxyisobutyrate dehydrogenase-like beta-hydroxyacid dehydrogenase
MEVRNMEDKRRIGFIGLGIMGSRMAGTLLRAGYVLNVFDIDKSKMDGLRTLGASISSFPKEVAKCSDIVFSSLPFPSTVKEVYLGPDGVIEGSSPGTILIDMSTVDPETTRSIYKVAIKKNVNYLDAPVSGGFKEAETGKLTIIVGGDEDIFKKCKDLLGILGSTVHYAGSSGTGNIIKLINNIMSLGNTLVAAEAFVLGVKAGVDGETLFNILRTSAGRSYHFEKRFPNILARNFAPGFTIDLAKKDLGLAVDMAKSLMVAIPATSLIHQLYNVSSSLGEGQMDFASIIKLFESWAKIQVHGTKG